MSSLRKHPKRREDLPVLPEVGPKRGSEMGKIFTFRVDEQNDKHTIITIFNRGANAGSVCVLTEDADEFIRRISGGAFVNQSIEGGVGPGAQVTGLKIGRLG